MNDRIGEGCAYGNLGSAYHSLGDFQSAIRCHKEDLSICRELKNKAGEGGAYGNLGVAYHSLGEYKTAIVYHKKHIKIVNEIGDKLGKGSAQGNIGLTYRALCEFKLAIDHHMKHLTIALEVSDIAGEGRAYSNLGSAYQSLGEFQRAIGYHKQSLSIAKEVGDKSLEGLAYGGLGSALFELGDFKRAEEYYKKRLAIAKKVGDRAGEGHAYCNLGNTLHLLGDLEKAFEYHTKELITAKEIGDRAGEGSANGNLGNIYQSLGDVQQSIEHHTKHVTIAKEVGDKVGEGHAYGNLGNSYQSLRDFERAIVYHKQDLSIAKEVSDKPGEAKSCFYLGLDFESLGSLHEALNYFRSSVSNYDTVRKNSVSEDVCKIFFRDQYRNAYTSLWRVLIKLQNKDEALEVAEQGRAQALMDNLKLLYGTRVSTPVILERKETIFFITRKTSSQTVFQALQKDTINFWILGKGKKRAFKQVKLETQSACKDHILMLIEKALKKIGAGVGARCENRSLDELNDDLLSRRGDGEGTAKPSDGTIDCLQPLFDTFIGPIEDLLLGDEIVIVPDGPLCLVPWAALSETIRIRTVPSLTVLTLITDSPEGYHSKRGALLVGDPCLKQVTSRSGKPVYAQLYYARKEVEMIREVLKVKPLTGKEATKRAVLEQITSVALIHIAAHRRKETGEIALAPNPGYTTEVPKEPDYILTMSDVQAVKLRARLVVLSCCHSGRGAVMYEGVVGMARAFLSAGARSVLVSLWAIDDEATMEFMKSFYKHLRYEESASVALHQAMKFLRELDKFCVPKYWAPFVLIGDNVTIEFGENK